MAVTIAQWRSRYKQYEPALFFTAGFLFDVFTLRRIDDWLKLSFQVLFMAILAYFLSLQYRQARLGVSVIPRLLTKIWRYQTEIVHFLFGSLLSAYAIFYFKSASLTRSLAFLAFIVILMVLNELEFVRKQGVKLKITLFSFCLASFLVYFIPVVNGHIGDGVFLLAIGLASCMSWLLILKITKIEPPEFRKKELLKLGVSCSVIHLFLVGCYFLKVIPPVPLSMTFGGVYHKVEKSEGKFELYSLRPWYDFWHHGDHNFKARDQEPVYCFVRVFAPAQFSHTIFLRWQLFDPRLRKFIDQDRIGMPISGGREDGFRGYAFKSHYQPGEWRVVVETEDERPIGEISFNLQLDKTSDTRIWMIEEG